MKKNLTGKMIDLTVASAVGGAAAGVIGGATGIPAPIRQGTQAMIGIGLLGGAANIVEDEFDKPKKTMRWL